ncbi:hypothetical protein BV133_848 [Blastochloris viridis]|uniref:Uncharacterized protein n=1 Tax=Blastochloris viridis TaxID=1079 RepID=A0A182D0L6_BLAVI|nr:hypothetical protein BV133_848 [Blastochloris viridis]
MAEDDRGGSVLPVSKWAGTSECEIRKAPVRRPRARPWRAGEAARPATRAIG